MRLSEYRLNGVFLAIVHLSLSFTMVFMVGKMTVTDFFMLITHRRREAKASWRSSELTLPAVLVTVFSRVCQVLMVVAVPLIPGDWHACGVSFVL